MKKWIFLSIIFALLTLQLSWPKFLTIFSCKPDLLLILSLALVFYLDFQAALTLSLSAGLAKDIFLLEPFALNTILFGIWSYLLSRLLRQISGEDGYVRLVIVLIAALLNSIIIVFQSINSGNPIAAGIFLRNLIISSVYTAALSPLVFKLVKKITA